MGVAVAAVAATFALAASAGPGGGGGHGLGRHAAQPFAPYVSVTPSTTLDTMAPSTVALMAKVFDRLSAQDERVLTVEGRLADGQDRTDNLMGLMIGIGLVQTLLFAAILFFTMRTARAATAATKVLPVLERAYVFLGSQTTLERTAELGARAAVKTRFNAAFTNHGRTPAVIRWVNLYHQYLGATPEGLYEDHERHGAGIVLGGGETQVFGDRPAMIARSDWEKAEAGQGGVYLHGRVVYSDIFSAQHETYFCWRYDIVAGVFTVVDSETLNRHD